VGSRERELGEGLAQPGGLCALPDGSVLVADTNHHRILHVAELGEWARELVLQGVPRAELLQ
jgi:sugar lactone lactonase YvrE